MVKPRMICIYGESGSTKTSQCYHLAKYLNQKYGISGRMIGSNASDSAPFEDSGMIEKGVVDFFDISNRELALADTRRLSTGFWPKDARTKTGELVKKGYFHTDDACVTTSKQWEKIGFYIVEGITGISNLLLNHIRQQEEGVGFKYSYKYEEDGYIIGGLQEGHYGLVQQEMYKLIVQGFASLPVKFVIFTALVAKGEDKKSDTVYGPKSAGKATTFEIPSWFMDCIHLDSVIEQKGDVNVERKVAWFQRHEDTDTGIPYLAKVRIQPELYPKLVEKWSRGYVPLGFKNGLNVLYQYIDEIVADERRKGVA